MSSESPALFPVYPQLPLEVVSGEGVCLKTKDGRTLIDFYGGHAVAGLGYRHPQILECLEATASRLFFQTTAIPSPRSAPPPPRHWWISPPTASTAPSS